MKLKNECYRLATKDHFHFTNDCHVCSKSVDDSNIRAVVWIYVHELLGETYGENHYACIGCLTELGVLN